MGIIGRLVDYASAGTVSRESGVSYSRICLYALKSKSCLSHERVIRRIIGF
jgi:hypothetical protein